MKKKKLMKIIITILFSLVAIFDFYWYFTGHSIIYLICGVIVTFCAWIRLNTFYYGQEQNKK